MPKLWFKSGNVRFPTSQNPESEAWHQRYRESLEHHFGGPGTKLVEASLPVDSMTPQNHLANPDRHSVYTRMLRGGHPIPPVVLREGRRPGTYQILDGSHRWYAARDLGVKNLDALVVMDDSVHKSEDWEEPLAKGVRELAQKTPAEIAQYLWREASSKEIQAWMKSPRNSSEITGELLKLASQVEVHPGEYRPYLSGHKKDILYRALRAHHTPEQIIESAPYFDYSLNELVNQQDFDKSVEFLSSPEHRGNEYRDRQVRNFVSTNLDKTTQSNADLVAQFVFDQDSSVNPKDLERIIPMVSDQTFQKLAGYRGEVPSLARPLINDPRIQDNQLVDLYHQNSDLLSEAPARHIDLLLNRTDVPHVIRDLAENPNLNKQQFETIKQKTTMMEPAFQWATYRRLISNPNFTEQDASSAPEQIKGRIYEYMLTSGKKLDPKTLKSLIPNSRLVDIVNNPGADHSIISAVLNNSSVPIPIVDSIVGRHPSIVNLPDIRSKILERIEQEIENGAVYRVSDYLDGSRPFLNQQELIKIFEKTQNPHILSNPAIPAPQRSELFEKAVISNDIPQPQKENLIAIAGPNLPISDKTFEHLLDSSGYLSDYKHLTADQIDRLARHYNQKDNKNLLNLIRSNPSVGEHTLEWIAQEHGPGTYIGGEAREKLSLSNPDKFHNESVETRFAGRLRKIRDAILATGKREIQPKLLPPGDWSVGRLPNGNISADKLQEAIDRLPATRYNVSHTTYNVAQLHSRTKPSQVFQLNLTTPQVQQLKDAGVWETFKRMHDASFRSGHPVSKHTIGWVRYTGMDPTSMEMEGNNKEAGSSKSTVRVSASQIRHKKALYELFDKHTSALQEAATKARLDALDKPPDSPEAQAFERIKQDYNKYRFYTYARGKGSDRRSHYGQNESNEVPTGFINWMESVVPGSTSSLPEFKPPRPSKKKAAESTTTQQEPQKGIFIDEVQSDLGQSFVRTAAALAAQHGHDVNEATRRAQNQYPDEHLKVIQKVVFGGKHPSELLQESFQQWLRNKGKVGTPVQIWQPHTKAVISGMSTDRALPGHMLTGYREVPEKKMGWQPAKYGELVTQDNKEHKDKDTFKDEVRKFETIDIVWDFAQISQPLELILDKSEFSDLPPTIAQRVVDVRKVLTDDLRGDQYRGHHNPMAGHCYVASEALYHMLGGREGGWKPMYLRHQNEPHWFLQHSSGIVVDPTADQFTEPVPYEKAVGKGFLTSQPSGRARKILERVENG